MPHAPRLKLVRTLLVLISLIPWIAACGGGTASQTAPSTARADGVVDPSTLTLTETIALEAGELVVGSEDASTSEVWVSLRAPAGAMVLDGCGRLGARTQLGPLRFGPASYVRKGETELLVARAERRALAELAEGTRPEVLTCDEVFSIDDRGARTIGYFAAGRVNVPEERWELRSVSVPGLDLRAKVSNMHPDKVLLELALPRHHVPPTGCAPLIVKTPDRRFRLGELEDAEDDDPKDSTLHRKLEVTRAMMQWAVTGDHAEITGCHHPWSLDALVIESLRSLVGTPPPDAEPPPEEPEPEDEGVDGEGE